MFHSNHADLALLLLLPLQVPTKKAEHPNQEIGALFHQDMSCTPDQQQQGLLHLCHSRQMMHPAYPPPTGLTGRLCLCG